MRILIADSYYPQFLKAVYHDHPSLANRSYEEQVEHLLSLRFSISDALSAAFRQIGHTADEIIINAIPAQTAWANTHGVDIETQSDKWLPDVLRAQILKYQPDVLLIQELSPVPDAFWMDLKPWVGLTAVQVACTIPNHRTLSAADIIFSSWPPLISNLISQGRRAYYLPLGFDDRLSSELGKVNRHRDITFIGGLGSYHAHRTAWLEHLCREVPIEVWGYLSGHDPLPPAIAAQYRGPLWGREAYRVLSESRITLNFHEPIAVAGQWNADYANNMRLYEATGLGACLLTDAKPSPIKQFEIGTEVLTYDSVDDCVQKLEYLNSNTTERQAIAAAGQRRSLSDHTYAHRCREMLNVLESMLSKHQCPR